MCKSITLMTSSLEYRNNDVIMIVISIGVVILEQVRILEQIRNNITISDLHKNSKFLGATVLGKINETRLTRRLNQAVRGLVPNISKNLGKSHKMAISAE